MKKKLFTLLLCAFAVVSANAWTVTISDDGKTATITGSGSDGQNLSDLGVSESAIKGAETLIFKGTINTLDPFQGMNCVATTVNYSNANFVQRSAGTHS